MYMYTHMHATYISLYVACMPGPGQSPAIFSGSLFTTLVYYIISYHIIL